MNFGDLTWTCHVCKEERPDACISVFKTIITLKGGVTMQQNVRYCNDRKACIENAPHISFLKDDA